jgi:site-specific recombinase XerD
MAATARNASIGARKRPKPLTTRPAEPLTDAEARLLLETIGTGGPIAIRNRALVALLWRSGLRISEALSLRPSDINMQTGEINVRRGKGRKQRMAQLDNAAVPTHEYLDRWLAVRASLGVKARAPLFCTVSSGDTRKPGEAIDPSYYRHLLPRLARKAGIDKRLHAHGLRHTYASELERSHLRIGSIQGLLGHEHASTTDTYLRKISGGELRDDLDAIGRTFTVE